MSYIVKVGKKQYGMFEAYDEAIGLWRELYEKHPTVVIVDTSRR